MSYVWLETTGAAGDPLVPLTEQERIDRIQALFDIATARRDAMPK